MYERRHHQRRRYEHLIDPFESVGFWDYYSRRQNYPPERYFNPQYLKTYDTDRLQFESVMALSLLDAFGLPRPK